MNVKIVGTKKIDRKYDDHTKPRIYIGVADYSPIHDMQSGERWNKPYNDIRSHLPDVLKGLGIDPTNLKFRWSQKAGCSCGCSPGFIVDGFEVTSEQGEFDVWIDYKYEGADAARNPPPLQETLLPL